MPPFGRDTTAEEGTVIRQHLGHYIVATGTDVIDCAISSRLRKQLQYPEASPGSRRRKVQAVRRIRVVDPVAIGDRVRFGRAEGDTGLIRQVLPRRNKISRRTSGTSNREQVLAANIDQALPVFSADEPLPDWDILDRMLAIAEWQEVPVTICFNKMDLECRQRDRETIDTYEQIGYPVVYTSVVSGLGREAFRELLSDCTSLFLGPSGAGKSSLLNWLQPGLHLRTGEISHVTGEGRHTTTHLELVELRDGGFVGDIPGVKEFRLWGITSEDVPELFREFQGRLGQCRFRDCSHVHEPGCAIKDALDSGDIHPRRYASYLRLRQSP